MAAALMVAVEIMVMNVWNYPTEYLNLEYEFDIKGFHVNMFNLMLLKNVQEP